jgi:hypothetical protein
MTKATIQLKRMIAVAMLAVLGLVPSPALAGPEGTYDMTGANAGDNSPYKGVVEVRKTGQTYAVTWRFGADETHGVGTVAATSERTFAVSYDAENGHGIALYELQGDGSWSGTWSAMGGETLGTEIWRPQNGDPKTRGADAGSMPASASTPDGQGAARR